MTDAPANYDAVMIDLQEVEIKGNHKEKVATPSFDLLLKLCTFGRKQNPRLRLDC